MENLIDCKLTTVDALVPIECDFCGDVGECVVAYSGVKQDFFAVCRACLSDMFRVFADIKEVAQ